MGMALGLDAISDDTVERILADPPLVWRIVAPDDPDAYEDARRAHSRPSLLARLLGRGGPPQQAVPDRGLDEGSRLSADVDKAWHGIHYLLTGSADEGAGPLAFLLTGGRPVGDVEVGYGPARAFTAAETRAIADALAQISDDALLSRYDAADMMAQQIYPEIWDRTPPEDDPAGYLLENLRQLRRFLQQAVDARMGMIVYLT